MRKPNISPLTFLIACTLGLLALIIITSKPSANIAGTTTRHRINSKAILGTDFIWQTFSRQFIAPFYTP